MMDQAQLPAFFAGLGIGIAGCVGLVVALRVQRSAYNDLREQTRMSANIARAPRGEIVTSTPPVMTPARTGAPSPVSAPQPSTPSPYGSASGAPRPSLARIGDDTH